MKDVLSRNIPVSGEMLKEKALQLAKSFGLNDFKASDGWLTRFKSRHAVCWKRIQGEAGNIDLDVLNEWQLTVLDVSLEQFSPDYVYNANEFGLFWQLLLNKTLTFKAQKFIQFLMDALFLGPNSLYPQISKAVNVEYDEDRGRHLMAVQKIPSGSVILINRCKSIVVAKRHLHCRRCGKFLEQKFLRCQKCDECRYCCNKCQKECNLLHSVECGLYKEISQLGFCELAVQVVLQLDPSILKRYFENEKPIFDRAHVAIGFSQNDLEAILSLECSEECPESEENINKLLDLIIPRLSKLPHWSNTISQSDIRPIYFRALKAILLRIPHNAYALVPEENRCENLLRPHSAYFPGWMLHEQILYAVGVVQESDRPGCSIIDVADEERSGSIIGGALFTIAAIANHSCRANLSHEDLSRLQPDYWVDKELDEFYQFFVDIKTIFPCGNLLFEQLTHLLAYNCVLELQLEKAEDCLNYIKESIERRIGRDSIEYANILLAYAALYYVWNLWLQQEGKFSKKHFDQVGSYLKEVENLYHAHVSPKSYRYKLIKWLGEKNQEQLKQK